MCITVDIVWKHVKFQISGSFSTNVMKGLNRKIYDRTAIEKVINKNSIIEVIERLSKNVLFESTHPSHGQFKMSGNMVLWPLQSIFGTLKRVTSSFVLDSLNTDEPARTSERIVLVY